MEENIDQETVELEEEPEETEEETPEPTDDPTALKARLQKLEEKAIAQRERTRILRQELAKFKKTDVPSKAPPKEEATGDLDETQLELLELKGISEDEDIDYIQKYMKRNGLTLRQTLRDEIVTEKLAKHKQVREVRQATPSATKRSGQGSFNDVDYWMERNSRTGELPDEFELRAKVVEAKMAKVSDRTPPWLK